MILDTANIFYFDFGTYKKKINLYPYEILKLLKEIFDLNFELI
jgi:hypothetical protein